MDPGEGGRKTSKIEKAFTVNSSPHGRAWLIVERPSSGPEQILYAWADTELEALDKLREMCKAALAAVNKHAPDAAEKELRGDAKGD
jgi:hypothetical protein